MVHKVGTERKRLDYSALIELTSMRVEVYDKEIFLELEEAAYNWECAIEKGLGLRGNNVEVRLWRCWND